MSLFVSIDLGQITASLQRLGAIMPIAGSAFERLAGVFPPREVIRHFYRPARTRREATALLLAEADKILIPGPPEDRVIFSRSSPSLYVDLGARTLCDRTAADATIQTVRRSWVIPEIEMEDLTIEFQPEADRIVASMNARIRRDMERRVLRIIEASQGTPLGNYTTAPDREWNTEADRLFRQMPRETPVFERQYLGQWETRADWIQVPTGREEMERPRLMRRYYNDAAFHRRVKEMWYSVCEGSPDHASPLFQAALDAADRVVPERTDAPDPNLTNFLSGMLRPIAEAVRYPSAPPVPLTDAAREARAALWKASLVWGPEGRFETPEGRRFDVNFPTDLADVPPLPEVCNIVGAKFLGRRGERGTVEPGPRPRQLYPPAEHVRLGTAADVAASARPPRRDTAAETRETIDRARRILAPIPSPTDYLA